MVYKETLKFRSSATINWQRLVSAKSLINKFRKYKLVISVKPYQTTQQIKRTKAAIIATAGMLLVICNQPLLADDYLKELATEAEATAAITKNGQLSSADKKQLNEMETILQTEKPSTYKFYVKLTKKKKERVLEAYVNDQSNSEKRLHHLQKKVMDLYFAP